MPNKVALWLASASFVEIVAFALFRRDGCKSCSDNNSPDCACWPRKQRQYVITAKHIEDHLT